MRAVVLREAGTPLTVEDVELSAPRSGEITVRVEASGVCHSDYHLLSVNGAEFKVTERLNSRIDVTIRYESVTPSGVESGDLEFKSSLEVSF